MKVDDVADMILILGKVDKRKGYNPRTLIGNQRMQKLIFFAQLLHIRRYGEKLFEEDMEAWQFGPVVRRLYERFNKWGSLDIPEEPKHVKEEDFSEKEIETIKEILDTLSNVSTTELIMASHNHPLWEHTWYNSLSHIDFDILLEKGVE